MKYSVIIPIYRGETTIEKVVIDAITFFEKNNLNFEIILMADNPLDESWQVIQTLQQKYSPNIKAAFLQQNIGQHAATIQGLKLATGNFIFTIDEDGQHNPADFKQFIQHQKNTNADIIYGLYHHRQHSFFRNCTSFFSKLCFQFFVPGFYWHYSSFRLITFETAQKAISIKTNYTFVDGILFQTIPKIASVQVQHKHDSTGRSSYTTQALVKHFFKIIIHYSFWIR
jgi:undecaprenyl-phosphate 4-deoxy-4-formamido-L-arabinose transferase